MLTAFLNPQIFAIVDLRPQGTTFHTNYFLAQVITPLHQLHATARQDNAHRKFECDVGESHIRLTPPISDFYLLGRIKEQLAGRRILDEKDLRKEIMATLRGLSDDEKSRAFGHWIARCERDQIMQVSTSIAKST
jgi:hypothetical protein